MRVLTPALLQQLQRHSQELCIATAAWLVCRQPFLLGAPLTSLTLLLQLLLLLLLLRHATDCSRLPGRQQDASTLLVRSSLWCRLQACRRLSRLPQLPWLPHSCEPLLLFHQSHCCTLQPHGSLRIRTRE